MTAFFMAATLAAILDHGPFFSEEAFMSLIRHWHVSSAWNNWYVSLLRPSNSKKLKLILEFNFIHNHIFSKVVYAFHVTSSMNQGYFLLFGLLGRTKMTHYLYLWNEYVYIFLSIAHQKIQGGIQLEKFCSLTTTKTLDQIKEVAIFVLFIKIIGDWMFFLNHSTCFPVT